MTKGSNQLKNSFMPIKSCKGQFMQFLDISKKKTPESEMLGVRIPTATDFSR